MDKLRSQVILAPSNQWFEVKTVCIVCWRSVLITANIKLNFHSYIDPCLMLVPSSNDPKRKPESSGPFYSFLYL